MQWTDDNCNGDVDETYPELGQAVTAKIATCADGLIFARMAPSSVVTMRHQLRVCNGLDDDCDGLADEELALPPATLVDGVCLDLVQSCGR